jgi:hypothetical protein
MDSLGFRGVQSSRGEPQPIGARESLTRGERVRHSEPRDLGGDSSVSGIGSDAAACTRRYDLGRGRASLATRGEAAADLQASIPNLRCRGWSGRIESCSRHAVDGFAVVCRERPRSTPDRFSSPDNARSILCPVRMSQPLDAAPSVVGAGGGPTTAFAAPAPS